MLVTEVESREFLLLELVPAWQPPLRTRRHRTDGTVQTASSDCGGPADDLGGSDEGAGLLDVVHELDQ